MCYKKEEEEKSIEWKKKTHEFHMIYDVTRGFNDFESQKKNCLLINFYRKYLINISHASFHCDDVSVCAAAVALDSCVTRIKKNKSNNNTHQKFLLQNLLQADRQEPKIYIGIYKSKRRLSWFLFFVKRYLTWGARVNE